MPRSNPGGRSQKSRPLRAAVAALGAILFVSKGTAVPTGAAQNAVVDSAGTPSAFPSPSASPSPIAALGRKIFFDTSLSASGQLSCATCHSPTHAYGPPNGLAVQLGGSGLDRQGARSVPS